MLSGRERTLSLLAQADAKFESKLAAHDVEREVFDALPGEPERLKSGVFFKRGRVGALEWMAFTKDEPVAGDDEVSS